MSGLCGELSAGKCNGLSVNMEQRVGYLLMTLNRPLIPELKQQLNTRLVCELFLLRCVIEKDRIN